MAGSEIGRETDRRIGKEVNRKEGSRSENEVADWRVVGEAEKPSWFMNKIGGGWLVGPEPIGEKEIKSRSEERKGESEPSRWGWADCPAEPIPISYFLFFFKPNQLCWIQIRFKLNPYALNQIKHILQHECTNKFEPREILITCERKLI
jgi:hypothetical protein